MVSKAIAPVVLVLVSAGCSSGSAGPPTGEPDASQGADSAYPGVDGGARDAAADANARDGSAGDGGAPDGASVSEGGLAYMIGIKTNSTNDGPGTVEGWLGRPIDIAGTTLTTTSFTFGPYTDANGAKPLLEVSFPLLSIFGESNNLNDMAQAASGAYDSTYEAMSQFLASYPNPLLSARIAWEFNGNWYAWSNGVGPNATYANFVSAFQHAAKMLRKHNPNVLIQWCVAWGQPDPTPYWPGAYDPNTNPGGVDVVSMDFYQANISQYTNGGKQSTWAMAQSGTTIDLDWMVSFAKKNNVKIALSEYGAGGPSSGGIGTGKGLDDGAWTTESIAWMNAQPPGFFLWNSEVGRRSVGVQTFWFQAVCANHIVWDAVEVTEFSRKHTANVRDGLTRIRETLTRLVQVRDQRRDGFVESVDLRPYRVD